MTVVIKINYQDDNYFSLDFNNFYSYSLIVIYKCINNFEMNISCADLFILKTYNLNYHISK